MAQPLDSKFGRQLQEVSNGATLIEIEAQIQATLRNRYSFGLIA